LRSFSARLRATVRAGDIVVRSGGDEFIVLCAGSMDTARLIAERLTGPIRERRSGAPAGPEVTASIGLAARRGAERSDTLLRRADRALMSAKAAGRRQVVEAP
jgi:diguanylate cyclase (GGDEF)-like protein